MKQIKLALFFAALIIASAYFLTHAEQFGFPALADERINGVVIGLILMWFGNMMPKQGPEASCVQGDPATHQTMRRFGGWVFAVAGLAYIGVWLVAPLEKANFIASAIVAGSLLLLILRATLTRSWV